MTRKEQVTLEQVYAIMNRLEDKLDHSLEMMGQKTAVMDDKINKIQNTLATLQGKLLGMGAVVSIAIVVVVEYIKGWILK